MKRCLLILICTLAATAATTTTWEMNSYQDFVKGHFVGVALDRDGRLLLAPKLETLFASGQPVIWAVAQAPDGSLYAATGHRGHVYRIKPDGTSSRVWTSDQPEIFAIAVGEGGVLYAASSPDGKVYRIDNGKASEVFAPKAKYIWSLAAASDGTLYVGTGEPANVYRVDRSGKSELYYETGQSHVTSLALDATHRVLAGTEPNGILYRIDAKDKAFVLYDANLPEIRSIVPMPDGTIYAAAMGGSLLNRTIPAAAAGASVYSTTVIGSPASITVTDNTQSGPELKPKSDSKPAQNVIQSAGTAAAVVDLAGVEKSAVYKINPDLTVETVWSSKEENAYGLLIKPNGEMLVSTDSQGRIYRQGPDRKPALFAQTNEGETTRLLTDAKGLLASTGDAGKLFRLSDIPGPNGNYESPVHDSGTVARWGRLTWRASGGRVGFQTRTGNSARPDKTWSDWSQSIADLSNAVVRSPNARYIQWRAELSGPAPVVENVIIAYLPQNNPPIVRSISVSTQAAPASAQKSAASAAASAAYSITVTDTGEAQSSSMGTPTQTLARGPGGQIQVTWQADDPDGDRIAYTVYFRGEEEKEWKTIRTNIFENSVVLDGDVLADGRYLFRVVATDRPSNDAASARQSELISSPVLIDNTPPVVTLSTPVRTDGHVEFDVDAVDRTSPLRRCEYSLDAGPWMPVEATDGVTDSPREQFHIAIDRLRAGEHLVVVRVYDTANNAGLAKAVVK